MVSLTIICFIIISLVGCNDDDEQIGNEEKINNKESIIGTWQLVEVFQSEGGPGTWYNIENGYTYTFFINGTFSSNRFDECANGTYLVESGKLTLNYGCEGFSVDIQSSDGVFVETINFELGYLFINPTYVYCFEGCNYKFKKIN